MDTTFVSTDVGTGNFDQWTEGPALPEPRTGASVAFVAGSIYVIGGRDASGVPTDTIFALNPDPKTGALGNWDETDLTLPEGRADAAGVVSPTGLLLIGGSNADGPVATTWKSEPTTAGALGEWRSRRRCVAPRPTPRSPSSATTSGSTAAVTRTGRSRRSNAARSAPRRTRGSRSTRTKARSSRGR